ncbi:MAG: c-type cytochrome [Myxococcota bacterium]
MLVGILTFAACQHPVDPGESTPATVPEAGGTLPVRHVADPEAAERGRRLFEAGTLFDPVLPVIGFRSLWMVWGTGPIADDDAYWAAFRERYGMLEAPYDNDGYPVGLRTQAGNALLDCYTCHVGEVAGQVVVGVANSTFDMAGLQGDLERLAALGGIDAPAVTSGTGAVGANDAWGLGVQLVNDLYPDPEVNLHFGYQRPGAWWTLKYKDRMYSDGAAGADGYRTMMAMLLAYGFTPAEAATLEPEFQDVQQFLWSLEAPAWPYDPPADDAVARGRAVFDDTCARCHGVHSGPDAAYPDRIVPLDEVGTDPVRAANFRQVEADFLNDSVSAAFGSDLLQATGGYLAPPLVGIWARAPYFHNASVPDLAGVVDSASRPDVWERTGSGADDYDPERVGWRYTVPADPLDASTLEGRRIHDAAREGLSNGGHPFGDALSDAERADLLAYLVTL